VQGLTPSIRLLKSF